MDPSGVLAELLSALPELASRLQVVASSLPDCGSGTLTAVNPGGTEPPRPPPPPPGLNAKGRLGAGRHASPPSLPEDEVAPPPPVAAAGMDSSGTRRTDAKPGSTKVKFSSITGPDIYYDGKSQKCLFDCWTALNAKRGVLRKEMMLIRRKKVMTLPPATYGYSDSEDELEADDGTSSLSSKPRESDAAAESPESRRRRLHEERLRAEEARKKEEDERRSKVFEYIDGCLDKAARACENAATVWLKGEGCIGHIVFITARIMDAVHKIDAELGHHVPADDGYDEGFEEELDGGAGQAGHPPEEELPHKKAGPPPGGAVDNNTHFRRRSTSRQPVEVSG